MTPRLLVAVLLAWTAPVFADAPTLKSDASVTLVGLEDTPWTLGVPHPITIEIHHSEQAAVHFPKRPHLGQHLRLVGHRSTRESHADGRATTRHELDVLPLRTGRQQLAAIEVAFVRGTDASTLSTPESPLTIGRSLGNETEPSLRAPTLPGSIEVTNTPLLYTLIALAAAILGILVALLTIRFLGPALRKAPRVAPPRPPHVVALERLQLLRESDWLEQHEFEAWFVELTDIMREYFFNRYRIHALGETSTELMAQLAARAPEGLDCEAVAELLAEADLIKFARQESAQHAAKEGLLRVQSIVETTQARTRTEDAERIPDWSPPSPAPLRLRAAGIVLDGLLLAGASSLLLVVPLPLALQPRVWPLWIGTFALLLLFRDLPGRSFGKRLLSLELVEEEAPCPTPPWESRIRRNLLLAIPVLGLAIESTWLLLDPESRRVGDRRTRCIVVERGSLEASRHVHHVREQMLRAQMQEGT